MSSLGDGYLCRRVLCRYLALADPGWSLRLHLYISVAIWMTRSMPFIQLRKAFRIPEFAPAECGKLSGVKSVSCAESKDVICVSYLCEVQNFNYAMPLLESPALVVYHAESCMMITLVFLHLFFLK